MQRILVFIVLFLVAMASHANDEAIAAAKTATTSWLTLIDSGDYAESWSEASTLFRGAIDPQSWQQAVDPVRAPLGELSSRVIASATYATSLPGAPKGEYVVVQLNTDFVNQAGTTETVTVLKDTDGSWRVAGYFIR